MKIIGAVLVIIGLVDVIGSWTGYDFWGEFMGVTLPDLLWYFSGYIELALGYYLFNLGSNEDESVEEPIEEE